MGDSTDPVDVFGLGQCAWDELVQAPHFPAPDEKVDVTGRVEGGGGPVATALVALSRWGRRGAFAGMIGDDDLGEKTRTAIAAEGVDVTGMIERTGEASQFAFIVTEPANGNRTVFCRKPTGSILRPDEIDFEKLRAARMLHTDGIYPDACLAAARAAREAGVVVSVDAGSLRPGMLELAGQSDIFVVSSIFAKAWMDGATARDVCCRLSEFGPRCVGVTLGRDGAVGLCEGAWIEVDAVPVRAVDTTGCGDVFHAGLAHGALAGWAWRRCFEFAAWAAAQVAARVGGRAGIPDAGAFPG